MREYKFRGISIETLVGDDQWLYGFGVHEVAYVDGRKEYWLNTESGTYMVDPETVGQYTGLTDRNGKEIYEGDILTSEHYPFQDEGKYNYHGVIEWIDEEASFYMTKRLANKEKRGISDGISQPIESIEEFEVIGNCWDNPDLLEGEKI